MSKGHFSEKEILPNFDLENKFCYFLDLYMSTEKRTDGKYHNKPLDRYKKQLANDAMESFVTPMHQALRITNSNNNNEIIESAIKFLRDVAENERNKEIAIVEQYIQHLTSLPAFNQMLKNHQTNITDLIESLKNFSNNPQSGQNLDDFYSKLTICINLIRNKVESFQARLEQLKSDTRATFGDLASNQYTMRAGSDFDGLLKNAIGIKEREIENSLMSNIQRVVIDYSTKLINDMGSNILTMHAPALLIAICADFLHYLQTQRDIYGGNIEDLISDMAGKTIEDYLEDWKKSDSFVLEMIRQNNSMLKETLTNIEEEMGFSYFKKASEAATKRTNEINYRNRTRTTGGNNPNYGRNTMLADNNLKSIYQNQFRNLDWIRFNPKTNRHGTIMEIIHATIEAGLKVKGHAATDTININLGKIEGSIDPKFGEMIYNGLKPVREKIEKFEKLQRKDRQTNLKKQFEEMNQQIEGSLKELDRQLNELNIPEDLFIYHDSLKLYIQIEEHKTDEFHGRELQIYNALDRLYSLNNINKLNMPQEELLYNLVLNLSELALGGKFKGEVENYLSIFAGMLMFDEIQNMAKEASKQATEKIEYSKLKNIHMYLLNEIYVPGSLLLTYIAQALETGYRQISMYTNAAEVKITTNSATNMIKEYNKLNVYGSHFYSIDDWSPMANYIEKNTKIQIIFMKSFLSFIENLQNTLQ